MKSINCPLQSVVESIFGNKLYGYKIDTKSKKCIFSILHAPIDRSRRVYTKFVIFKEGKREKTCFKYIKYTPQVTDKIKFTKIVKTFVP